MIGAPDSDHSLSSDPISRLYRLLGGCPVLLPIKKRHKGPSMKGWQKFTWEESQTAEYQEKLRSYGNTGVLLGSPSEGLCSIDIDDDSAVEPFLNANPTLRNTLRTKGSRGENIWVRINGTFPRVKKLKIEEEAWGEWRANGGQTVIAGTHPTGRPYTIVREAPPIEIKFDEIVWPSQMEPPAHAYPPHLSAPSVYLHHSSPSASSTPSTLLHNKDGCSGLAQTEATLLAIRSRKTFEKEHSTLVPHYRTWIEKVYNPKQGERNKNLIEMVTFLAHCVGPEQVLLLTGQFYDRSAPIWTDSREQHQHEATSHLHTILDDFRQNLLPGELAVYNELDQREQSTFRICRDLASRECAMNGKPQFYLACDNLASRVGGYSMQAFRILRNFQSLAIIEIVERGLKKKKGQKGKATTYGWLYSISENFQKQAPKMPQPD